jgi:hypothetical protein
MTENAKTVFRAMARADPRPCNSCGDRPAFAYDSVSPCKISYAYCSDDCLLHTLAMLHTDETYAINEHGQVYVYN